MDKQDCLINDGNQEKYRGEKSNPLVTFILFAYNQEAFIREAVESALAQTYQPLEVIISDDASTDRTFDIIQEIVADYVGPHQIKIAKNTVNQGLIDHVISRGKEAKGEIVVVAAGDDISELNRVRILVSNFHPEATAIFSKVSIIDNYGKQLRAAASRPIGVAQPPLYIKCPVNEVPVIQGCSAAYRKTVFNIPIDPTGKNYPEDLLFSFYLNLKKYKIQKIQDVLVRYRWHDAAWSNRPEIKMSARQSELSFFKLANSKFQMASDFLLLAKILAADSNVEYDQLTSIKQRTEQIVTWPDLGFWSRLISILGFNPNSDALPLKWKLMRLWGMIPDYQPRRFLKWLL